MTGLLARLGRAGAISWLGWAVLLAGALDRDHPSENGVAGGSPREEGQTGSPARVRTREPGGMAGSAKTEAVSNRPQREGTPRDNVLSRKAVQQIGELLEAKKRWTPAQRKVSSTLLKAQDGTVTVDIRSQATPEVLERIRDLGGSVVNSVAQYGSVRAQLPAKGIETVASLRGVRSIRTADQAVTHGKRIGVSPEVASRAPPAATTHGVVRTKGILSHQVDLARQTHGVDGAGIGIGVIASGVDSLARRQAAGELPDRVTVLPGQAGKGTAGITLLEIAHDLAPEAELYFATGEGGEAQLAVNIEALCDAGADVIIGGTIYLRESAFQDNVVTQAVNAAVADGCVYISAAGDFGNLNNGSSAVWEGDFAAGTPLRVDGTQVGVRHDFGGGLEENRITSDSYYEFILQWADPLGASANDYDLFLVDENGEVIASSTDTQDGTQDPIEVIDSRGLFHTDARLVIVKASGSDRYLRLSANYGRLEVATAGSTFGHRASENAVTVAAVGIRQSGSYAPPFDGTESVRWHSSDGPRRIFYQADGTPITPGNFSSSGGTLLQKPDIAAADGVDVAYLYLFSATTYAAAHTGGIAALMLEAAGGPANLTLASLRAAMSGSALDIEAEGVDRDSGAGIVMAPGAVAAVVVATEDRNHAPTASGILSDRTLAPDDSAVTIDVSGAFDDPDDDTLTYAALSSDPERIAVGMTGASLTLSPVSPVLATVTVRATDPGGLSAVQSFTVTVRVGTRDYDTDDDGLIEVATLAQLDGMRYDLDGNGQVDDPGDWQAYFAAFSQGALDMGCSQGCTGYELREDLDFDTDASGDAGTGDTYWNGGDGWLPIGEGDNGFTATFEGNGHVLSFLYIDRSGEDGVGLFGSAGGALRGVGLTGVDVTGQDSVGALVGDISEGSVRDSHATGRVEGRDAVGGLAGRSGTVSASYAAVSVSGARGVGGLVGHQAANPITASYATGDVTGTDAVGGLVGASDDQILAGYATGMVSGRGSRRSGSQVCGFERGGVGGLVGNACSTIWASYATGVVSGTSAVGGLAGTGPTRFRSTYWDRETSGVQVGFGEDDANGNGVVDGTESPTPGVAGRATAALQAPTGYRGIFRAWNLDLDGDNVPDDPWHFGTAAQYPALSADLNADGRVTWQEFGYQLREGPMLNASSPAGQARVELSWTMVETNHWRPAPAVTYTLYRDDGNAVDAVAEDLEALLHTDTGVSIGATYNYQVTAVVAGGEAARSTRFPVIVGAANQPPAAVGELENMTLREGTATVAIDVSGAFRDPEGDALDYEASSSSTGVVAVNVLGTELTITPASAGRAVVTVTATDTSGSNSSAEQSFAVTVWPVAAVDYDADEDRLIEIRTLAQLDAVRHDLDGDGNPALEGAAAYAAAFADAAAGMGCDISDGCAGYELIADLDFDTNGSGRIDAGDDFWNDGAGWVPIGGAGSMGDIDMREVSMRRNPFHAVFEGNGHAIANLYSNSRDRALFTGLFGYAGSDSEARSSSVIRNVGVIDIDLTGYNNTGGLVGWNEGKILTSYSTGAIWSLSNSGGLVGWNEGTIISCYSAVELRGHLGTGTGGLVGWNAARWVLTDGVWSVVTRGVISGSYATGRVSAWGRAGGLVGQNEGTINASYATGFISASFVTGGLAGESSGRIMASYATGQARSFSSSRGDGLVDFASGFIEDSYFDSRTSVWSSFSYSFRARRTEDLQAPTGYTGLYRNWNVDLDGDDQPDDPWHFGTSRQYPVLKADLDGDGRATWQEFGYQIREGPTLSARTVFRDGMDQVDLTWTGVNTRHWNPAPSVTYTLTRPTGSIIAEDLSGLRYTDLRTTGNCCAYQVAAVVSGGEATRSSPSYVELPDREGPSVSRFGFNLIGSEATWPAGFVVEVFVDFTERVRVTGKPRLKLELGGGERTATFTQGGGFNFLYFSYTVAVGDIDTDGMSIPAGSIDLNGGSITDEAGNPAMLDYPAVEPKLSHKVDGNKPVLLGAAVNQALLTLTYGETIHSGSSGDFTVEVGGVERSIASLAVNGGVVELTLATAVGSGDSGITVSYSPGTDPIRDLAGNWADALSNQPVTNTTGASNAGPQFTGSTDLTTVENRTERWRLTATDADDGDEVTGWEISGGADQARFIVGEVAGELGFSEAPDYETPADLASPAGDNEYVVMVRVTSGAGSRALTAEQEIRITVEDEDEPPGAPQSTYISESTLNSLMVEWTAPENRGPAITGYRVRYRDVEGGGTDEVLAGTALSWTLTGLDEDTLYEVQVQAINDEGAGSWSEPVNGRTEPHLTVEITTLEEPPVEGPFAVRFAFSETVEEFDVNDIEIGLESDCLDSGNNPIFCDPDLGTLRSNDIFMSTRGSTFILTLTPRIDGVANNYTLGVRLRSDRVRSSRGEKPNREGALEVRVAPPGVTLAISALDLAASPASRSVRLSWNQPLDDGGSPIIRYEYRYAAVGEGFGPWRSVSGSALGVMVGNLIGGREYVFEVRAVNALGKGGAGTVMATPLAGGGGGGFGGGGGGGGSGGLLFPPEAPAALTATAGDEAVRLEWSPPVNDGGTPIQRYEYRLKEGRGDVGEWTPIPDSAVDEVNASGYTVGDLLNGTVYAFELRGVNAAGNGQESEPVEVRMPLDPAYWSNFRAEDLEGVELTLEAFLLEGSSRDRELRFGEGLRFEEDELDGEREVTATDMGSYKYRYTSRTTGELSLEFDGGESCRLRLTFSGDGTGSYSYRCGGTSRGQGSFRMSELENRVPEITGAGPFEVEENTTRVGQVAAVDWDEEDEVTGYGIAGGADQALFAIETATGELSFKEAPDYESPGDLKSEDPASPAADNEYILVVEVTSGEGDRERTREQSIRVRVTDVEMEEAGEDGFQLMTGSRFVPVILTTTGRNNSFFTSELTLTNRGDEAVTLNYTYTARDAPEERSGTASDLLPAGRQQIRSNALDYLRDLGIPIPETGNQVGTVRVEAPLGSEVRAVVRTTTVVPDGRAGLAYLGIAEEEGFDEPVYLCGMRQNSRDRSNVAFQNMGAPGDGAITLKTTVYSGEASDTSARELKEVKLEPGGFHQYNQVLNVLGSEANGYVKVERVEGEASFYAYGVINDQANSDGSFVFPVTASSLEGKMSQTLPVIVETRDFTSELTVTNFSDESRTLDFEFVSGHIQGEEKVVGFQMELKAGEQAIVPELVETLRREEMVKLGRRRGFYLGPLFVTAEEGDLSGIVVGARTSSQGGGGQYGVFYNAVPEGEGFVREAWVEGLQQNEENRSNLALVNTGEVNDSPSVFHLEIYNGETGMLEETVVTRPIPSRGWHQVDGILMRAGPETRQGYVRIEKVSGENPFLAYGVVNDGGAPGQRSGDGAYLPAGE